MELEESLSDAALRGDVVALADLLTQDPNILEKHYLKCEDKNVLHVAAILGNVEFFQAVLRANSSFCHEMCLARDRVGRNPIHAAASYGKLDILNLIKDHDWLVQAALEKTDNGGTILHLCVKHDQLDALRLLLGIFTNPEFQKARDGNGMTMLHLAFYYNQNQRRREVIIYLLNNVGRIVDYKNLEGKTALDLFLGEARNVKGTVLGGKDVMIEYDKEIADSLLQENAREGWSIISLVSNEWFDKRADAIMVVASVIATMAFQAMVSPPGGTWQDELLEGDSPHRVGESVMAKTHPKYYKHLVQANTVAFVSSLCLIILIIRGVSSSPSRSFFVSSFMMWLSVAAIAVVYGISLVAIVPESARASNLSASGHITVIVIAVWSLIILDIFRRLYKLLAFLKRIVHANKIPSKISGVPTKQLVAALV